MDEIWKDVSEFGDIYQVSNLGRIKNAKSDIILSQYINKARGGYHQVSFTYHGKHYTRYVHRVVAKAFIPNPDNLPEVNHKDENKSNNNVNNLEWCTSKYNIHYSGIPQKTIPYLIAYSNQLKKPVCQYTKDGVLVNKFDGVREAERVTGLYSNSISKCCLGKQEYVGNFIWRYEGDAFDKFSGFPTRKIAVIQYDKNYIEVRKWESIREIQKTLGYDHAAISRCCRGQQKTSYGFIWKFA